MIRRPPRSTLDRSSAASDVYKRQVLLAGMVIWLSVLFQWFSQAIGESEGGLYSERIDVSYRWSMSWFIFSEVMFFAAFFGALFYARVYSLPWLGDPENKLLWPDFHAQWPSAGPYQPPQFGAMHAWGIPALNTFLLLSSGVTVTYAHWALKENNRKGLILGLAATVALGFTFLGFQIYEYVHAYSDLNLKLSSGVFGSTFYMLTGFHGFHVTLGAVMLTVILFRSMAGHFTPENHFAFEAVPPRATLRPYLFGGDVTSVAEAPLPGFPGRRKLTVSFTGIR